MPLIIVRNDITKMRVDAIVNAANETLLGGGGVDGAIHRAAGPGLLKECRTLGGCRTGEAKLTRGYDLPCRYVIHTVGPVWQGGGHGERALLEACYVNSLKLARDHGCETVAFPLISSGVYGYPKGQALRVAVDAITRFLEGEELTVYLVVYSRDAFEVSTRLYSEVQSYIDDVYVDAHFDDRRATQRRPSPKPMDDELSAPAAPYLETDRAAVSAFFSDGAALGTFSEVHSLDDMLSQVDEGFSQALIRKINEKGMTDAECYKRANIDRRLFNKIKNNPGYRPGKQTVLAFVIALKLTLEEARDLLMKAGYALSHSSKSDIVVEYCLMNGKYDIFEINEVLFKLDLQPLGY